MENKKQYLFLDFRPVEDCQNPDETFGEICLQCNKRGRFNLDYGKLLDQLDREITAKKDEGKNIVIMVTGDLYREMQNRCPYYGFSPVKDLDYAKGFYRGVPVIVGNIATFKIFKEVKE